MSTKLAKNTLYLTVASIGQKVIAFVYFLFLARVMQPENTGAYFLATSLVVIFSVVADFGITPVLIRHIAKHQAQTKEFAQRALGLKAFFIVLGVVGLNVTSFLLGYDVPLRFLIALASVILVLDSLHVFFYGILRGHQDLTFESIGMFAGMFVTAILGGSVLLFAPSLVWLVLALACGSLVNVIISGYGVGRVIGWNTFQMHWDFVAVRTLLISAVPFALAAIFAKVYSYIDSIMISKFLGTLDVGLYSIAYKFTYAFQFLPLAFIAALYPSFSATIKHSPTELARLFERAMWYMMLIATPIVFGLWLVAPEAVLLAGDEYAPATIVLQTLIFVLFPIFLDFPIGSLLNAADRQVTKTGIIGITMICNAVLNFLLIPLFGILGAAYAALASFSLMFVLGLATVPSIIPGYSYRQLVWMLTRMLCSGLVMYIIGIVMKPVIGWMAVIPLCAFVYVVFLFVTHSVTRNDVRSMKLLLRLKTH